MNGRSWPADKVERRNIETLIPYARNSRTHSDEQVTQIAASIKEWGFTNPILIDGDNGIIAGHGRFLAAKKLNLQDVPCIEAKDWTEAQKKAYVIADNKLALNAGWDDSLLKIEFRDRIETIHENEIIIVPKGVEHRPIAEEEVSIMLFEPATTINTGDLDNERTRKNLDSL